MGIGDEYGIVGVMVDGGGGGGRREGRALGCLGEVLWLMMRVWCV